MSAKVKLIGSRVTAEKKIFLIKSIILLLCLPFRHIRVSPVQRHFFFKKKTKIKSQIETLKSPTEYGIYRQHTRLCLRGRPQYEEAGYTLPNAQNGMVLPS